VSPRPGRDLRSREIDLGPGLGELLRVVELLQRQIVVVVQIGVEPRTRQEGLGGEPLHPRLRVHGNGVAGRALQQGQRGGSVVFPVDE